MNNFFLIISILLLQSNSQYIEGNKFSGYIFSKNHEVYLTIENQKERFTPSKEDIIKAELLLKNKLECENKDKLNQLNGCPVIHKKLKFYSRQYVGFVNSKNEKIIWINFIWKKKVSDAKLKEDIYFISDGCSNYWNIFINLDKEDLFDLRINGKG